MIGLAAVLLMVLHGRIFGATGILNGLLRFDDPSDWTLRAALVAGMATGPFAYLLLTGAMPTIALPVSLVEVIVGGVVVGIGVRYGGGCTSGHGVCGNARFSRRSIFATLTFMATAIATVFVIRHVLGA